MTAAPVERGCPRCWVAMPESMLRAGSVQCGSCELEFTAAVFEPRTPVVQKPLDAAAVSASHCARHPRNAALAACDQCGAFMCSLCRVDSGGRAICTQCFERLGTDELSGTYRSWHSAATLLALSGIIVSPAGLILGAGVVAAAVAARKQARRWGEEVTRFTYVWLIALGVLEMALGLFIDLAMVSK